MQSVLLFKQTQSYSIVEFFRNIVINMGKMPTFKDLFDRLKTRPDSLKKFEPTLNDETKTYEFEKKFRYDHLGYYGTV